jgi:hypothetical protein
MPRGNSSITRLQTCIKTASLASIKVLDVVLERSDRNAQSSPFR